jgi:YVTN family beta-propeller protein
VAAGLALAGRAHAAGAPAALAYIADQSAGRISVVDTSTNTVTGTIAVGSGRSVSSPDRTVFILQAGPRLPLAVVKFLRPVATRTDNMYAISYQ